MENEAKWSSKQQDLADILSRDWRPWAYAALALRAPAAWTTVVRRDDIMSIVPEAVAEGGTWRAHQQYLCSVLKCDSEIWITKPTQFGARRGVIVRPWAGKWAEEHEGEPPKNWRLPELLDALDAAEIEVPDTKWLEEVGAFYWEIPWEDARAVAILIELLCLHLDGEPLEEGLHLVE